MDLDRFPFRTMQVTLSLVVGFGAIYFSETNNYPINPALIGVWSFLAAYGATLGLIRASEWLTARKSRRIGAVPRRN